MDLVRRAIEECVNSQDLDSFDEVFASGYIRHSQAMPPGQQHIRGLEAVKKMLQMYSAAIPNYYEEIDIIMADGDKVAIVTTGRGTQTGQMGPYPATGKKFMIKNFGIFRIENDKIAESWVSWDNVAFLTQLGLMPAATVNTDTEPAKGKAPAREKIKKKAPAGKEAVEEEAEKAPEEAAPTRKTIKKKDPA
jgi:predicted ester cyclase